MSKCSTAPHIELNEAGQPVWVAPVVQPYGWAVPCLGGCGRIQAQSFRRGIPREPMNPDTEIDWSDTVPEMWACLMCGPQAFTEPASAEVREAQIRRALANGGIPEEPKT